MISGGQQDIARRENLAAPATQGFSAMMDGMEQDVIRERIEGKMPQAPAMQARVREIQGKKKNDQ